MKNWISTVCIVCLMLFTFKAENLYAQPAYISLQVHRFSVNNSSIVSNSFPGFTKGYDIIPSVGYYHYIKGNTGIGLSFGKNFQYFEERKRWGVINHKDYKEHNRLYFISLAV